MSTLHWHGLNREWRGYVWLDKNQSHGRVARCLTPACIAVLPGGGLH